MATRKATLRKRPVRNPYTLTRFLAFARTKPADEAYVYSEWRSCPLAQYTSHLGLRMDNARREIAEDDDDFFRPLVTSPRTWGALVTRLEERLRIKAPKDTI